GGGRHGDRGRGAAAAAGPEGGGRFAVLAAALQALHIFRPPLAGADQRPCACTRQRRSATWPWWATARAARPPWLTPSRSWPARASATGRTRRGPPSPTTPATRSNAAIR